MSWTVKPDSPGSPINSPTRPLHWRYREFIAEDPTELPKLVEGLYAQGFYFRGQPNADWPLSTRIEREYAAIERVREEHRILREFQSRAHVHVDHLPSASDPLEWLAIIQHHGGPTRLLDFTDRVYVAAFFAVGFGTLKAVDQVDAAVWAVNAGALNQESTRFVFEKKKELAKYQGRPGFNLLFRGDNVVILGAQQLPYQAQGLERNAFAENILTAAVNYGLEERAAFPVLPRRLNRRMQAQRSLFVAPTHLGVSFEENLGAILGERVKFESDNAPEPLREQNTEDMYTNDAVLKVIIPHQAFTNYWVALREMNITEDVLFPDLEGLIRSLAPPSREWAHPWRRTQ